MKINLYYQYNVTRTEPQEGVFRDLFCAHYNEGVGWIQTYNNVRNIGDFIKHGFHFHNIREADYENTGDDDEIKGVLTLQSTHDVSWWETLYCAVFKRFPKKTTNNLVELLSKLKCVNGLTIKPLVTIHSADLPPKGNMQLMDFLASQTD